ncbi:protein isoforms a h i [Lasius niger]|uniref:Protein isoforms a h i n=1 Tax=Lasius niger TaxID=67767 RepID=A0A0J7NRS4_LASNI|nr:protein isoforms a h i [Lasius niger]
MPHVSSSGDGGDELATEDEIKLYKHEGEEDKTSSENLTEDKSDLIDLTESEPVMEVNARRDNIVEYFAEKPD